MIFEFRVVNIWQQMAALERKVHRDRADCTNVREVTVVTVVTVVTEVTVVTILIVVTVACSARI